jgi:hypothetical protein
VENELTPQDEAKRLIALAEDTLKQKVALIERLKADRSRIDADLILLGAKRTRKSKQVPAKTKAVRTKRAHTLPQIGVANV